MELQVICQFNYIVRISRVSQTKVLFAVDKSARHSRRTVLWDITDVHYCWTLRIIKITET